MGDLPWIDLRERRDNVLAGAPRVRSLVALDAIKVFSANRNITFLPLNTHIYDS